jgi:hypothetical protein
MIFNQLLQDKNLSRLLEEHCGEILSHLLEHNYDFGVVVNKDLIDFDPPLPEEVYETIPPMTYLMLAGYSLESAAINDTILSFEAGFGSENFGSLVCVDTSSIIQIVVDELSIFVNLYAGQKKEVIEEKVNQMIDDNANEERSRNIFLSNPENKKFF